MGELSKTVDVGEDEGGDPRCPVVLLLDTSGSMGGAPISQLNEGIKVFETELKADDLASRRCEIAVISFGGQVSIVQDFTFAGAFAAPALHATGGTPMGEAIERGIAMVTERKQYYKDQGLKYYRPWIFLVTDGAPTDPWQAAAQRVRDGDSPEKKDGRKFMFFSVGVQGADVQTLQQIAPPHRPPRMLQGLKFREMFQWLSASLGSVSNSNPGDQVALPQVDGWTTTS